MSDPKYHYQQRIIEYTDYLDLDELKGMLKILVTLVVNQELIEETKDFLEQKVSKKDAKESIKLN